MGVVVRRRYTYGPVKMSKAAYTGKYALLFNTSYWDSRVEIQIDNELASVDPSGTDLALPGDCSTYLTLDCSVSPCRSGGYQYTLSLQSTNRDSDISLQYELIVIRPYPECASERLSEWSESRQDDRQC